MARQRENSQLADHNPRWWQVLGSNQRRLSRRFYSPILLFETYATDLRLCVPRRDLGPPPSAMRPCARSRWRGDARTGTDGGVRRPRLHALIRAFLAFDLRRSICHLTFAVFLAARVGLGVFGAEGVGDALVGGIGLPVDAVSVDLEQDGDAVPGAAGDLGGVHHGVQPQRRPPHAAGHMGPRGPVKSGTL